MSKFHRNTKTVKDIYEEFSQNNLVIDNTYQRRAVWSTQDKVRFVETILLDLVVPEVFFWTGELDEETGKSITHIVDGQQRITAIVDFIDGAFSLTEKYLLSANSTHYANMDFTSLDGANKKKIWSFNIPVVEIHHSLAREDIIDLFYRLNLTTYNLNEQEKRNRLGGAFADAALALSGLDFWANCQVFSSSDFKRMKDVEFCSSIYILAKEGVIDQTKSSRINDYYDAYSGEFDSDTALFEKITKSIDVIMQLADKVTMSFVSKKTQMYTLFSMAFKMLDKGDTYSTSVFERFKLFVIAYNSFRNEYDIKFENEKQRKANEFIKRYKLASSEGINKYKNRMIRLEILYDICFDNPVEIKESLKELHKFYDECAKSSVEIKFESFDPEELSDIKTL